MDVCQPAFNVVSRRDLHSASRRLLEVPRYRHGTFAQRAFAVAGPSVWNLLPDYLSDPAVGRDTFRKHLKTFLFARYYCMQRISGVTIMRYINSLLLTYLCVQTITFKWNSLLLRYLVRSFTVSIFRSCLKVESIGGSAWSQDEKCSFSAVRWGKPIVAKKQTWIWNKIRNSQPVDCLLSSLCWSGWCDLEWGPSSYVTFVHLTLNHMAVMPCSVLNVVAWTPLMLLGIEESF